jgi:hypothetical protein
MESTKHVLLNWEDVYKTASYNVEDLNPIDKFLYEWEPAGAHGSHFRKLFLDALNHDDEESLLNHNMNVVGLFMAHVKEEFEVELPDKYFESYFGA